MSKTTHPANVVPLTESEQFVHIYVNTFAQFSPTCAGSYCQRTPHKNIGQPMKREDFDSLLEVRWKI